jgi:hypothetical protein
MPGTEGGGAMRRPGSKYFKCRLICGEQLLQVVVWDGVCGFENAPPLQVIALIEKMRGVQLCVQVDEDAIEDIHEVIAAPCRSCPEVGGLVVWTRDHRTYCLIVHRLTEQGCVRMM